MQAHLIACHYGQYINYYFGEEAETTMFNSDMMLYFLNAAEGHTKMPLPLIDQNIRIDYGKLRHLMAVNQRLDVRLRRERSVECSPTRLNGNEQIRQQASVRDHLHGEKVIQGFLIAYLNVTHNFLTWSEREMGGDPSAGLRTSFVDLYLEPFLARYPDIKYGYLIELESICDTQFNKKGFDQALAKEKAEAEGQLRQYAHLGRIARVAQQVTLKKLALIYKV